MTDNSEPNQTPSEWLAGFLANEQLRHDNIRLKRVFIDINDGNLHDGILFSQIVYWHMPNPKGQTRLRFKRDGHLWLAKTNADWWEECRIDERTARDALDRIEHRGLIIKEMAFFRGKKTTIIRLNWKLFEKRVKEMLAISDPAKRREVVKRNWVSTAKATTKKTKRQNLSNDAQRQIPNDAQRRTITETVKPETTSERTSNDVLDGADAPLQAGQENAATQLGEHNAPIGAKGGAARPTTHGKQMATAAARQDGPLGPNGGATRPIEDGQQIPPTPQLGAAPPAPPQDKAKGKTGYSKPELDAVLDALVNDLLQADPKRPESKDAKIGQAAVLRSGRKGSQNKGLLAYEKTRGQTAIGELPADIAKFCRYWGTLTDSRGEPLSLPTSENTFLKNWDKWRSEGSPDAEDNGRNGVQQASNGKRWQDADTWHEFIALFCPEAKSHGYNTDIQEIFEEIARRQLWYFLFERDDPIVYGNNPENYTVMQLWETFHG